MINAKDPYFLWKQAVYQDIPRSGHESFTRATVAAGMSDAGKTEDQAGLLMYPSFDEGRSLPAIFGDVGRQFFQIVKGSPAPNQPHAVRFNFLALRMA